MHGQLLRKEIGFKSPFEMTETLGLPNMTRDGVPQCRTRNCKGFVTNAFLVGGLTRCVGSEDDLVVGPCDGIPLILKVFEIYCGA